MYALLFVVICRFKKNQSGIPLVSKCLDPDQVQHLVGSDLGPPGRVAQSVTCLATDANLTADPGVASSIPAWSNTVVEIDNEIISMVILLPSAESS